MNSYLSGTRPKVSKSLTEEYRTSPALGTEGPTGLESPRECFSGEIQHSAQAGGLCLGKPLSRTPWSSQQSEEKAYRWNLDHICSMASNHEPDRTVGSFLLCHTSAIWTPLLDGVPVLSAFSPCLDKMCAPKTDMPWNVNCPQVEQFGRKEVFQC